MTTIKTSLASAALLSVLFACAQAPMAVSRPAVPEDILVSVANPEQQRLWRKALSTEKLPPVDVVRVPHDPVETIRVAKAPETQPARVPALPDALLTAVVPLTLPARDGVFSRARVLEAAPEKLSLLIEDGERLELAYRRPSRAPVAGLQTHADATVETLLFAPVGPARRYGVAVGDAKQTPALVVLQDSGDRPIAREFRLGPISIRQVLDAENRRMTRNQAAIPSGGAPVPVEITVGGRSATFPPGAVVEAAKSGIGYDVVIYESSMHPAEAARSDTPPFALHAAIFAAYEQ